MDLKLELTKTNKMVIKILMIMTMFTYHVALILVAYQAILPIFINMPVSVTLKTADIRLILSLHEKLSVKCPPGIYTYSTTGRMHPSG